MRIYVPSRGRHLYIESSPLAQLGQELCDRYDLTIVVPPGEAEVYLDHLPFQVRIVECPEWGIAGTRRWIGEVCERGKFLMMDDDVKFYQRKSPESIYLEYADDLSEMLLRVDSFLDYYAHVAVSARFGNNTMGTGGPDFVAVNGRTLRVLGYRKKEFLLARHGRVQVMEDFDVNLQLLEMGHQNAIIGYWAQDQKMTNAPGGCSLYRNHDIQDEAARTLAALHPDVVRLRQKKNKGGGEFGSRTEVTIYWKKAYRASNSGT